VPYSQKQRFRVAEHVSITQVEDESVLLDLNSGAYYGLNHVGTQLLSHFQNEICLSDAVKEISLEYQVLESLISKDVDKLLAQLVEQQLLELIE